MANRSVEQQQQREARLDAYSRTARAELATRDQSTSRGKKWLSYGAAASAALVGSSQMDTHALYAAIQYSGAQNIMISGSLGITLPNSTYLDLDGDGVDDFGFAAFATGSTNGISVNGGAFATFQGFGANGGSVSIRSVTSFQSVSGSTQIDTGGNVRALASGSLVGTSGSSFNGESFGNISNQSIRATTGGSILHSTNFNTGFEDGGFIGVQFDTNNGAGVDRFGWIRVDVDQFDFNNASINNKLTIIDWAWEDSGAHILAGATGAAVPEPSSAMLLGLGTLALGAVGVRNMRRKKKQGQPSDTTVE